MKRWSVVVAALALFSLTTLNSASAQVYIDLVEKDDDVVATVHGSLDISALSNVGTAVGPTRIYPSLASFTSTNLVSSTNILYRSINGPSSFGLSDQTNGTASAGNDTFVLSGAADAIVLSNSYASGDPLYAVTTFTGQSLASLQITDNQTFTWDWGGSTASESVILRIGSAAPPAVLVSDFPNTIGAGDSITANLKPSAFTGTDPITYSLSGNVPPGLSVSGDQIVGTPTTAGTYTFTVTGEDDLDSASETLNLTVRQPPGFSKVFTPDELVSGATSTLSFTIDNSASVVPATALDFTDTLPAGVTVANPANAATTCMGGTLTATAGAGVISYTGGSVAAGAGCTVSADVTSTTPGTHVNTSGALTSSSGNSGTATDTLTVVEIDVVLDPSPWVGVNNGLTIVTGAGETIVASQLQAFDALGSSAIAFTYNLQLAIGAGERGFIA